MLGAWIATLRLSRSGCSMRRCSAPRSTPRCSADSAARCARCSASRSASAIIGLVLGAAPWRPDTSDAGERAVLRRLARLYLRGRLRGVRPGQAPGRDARRAARQRGALPPDRRERRRPDRAGRPRRALALHQPVVPARARQARTSSPAWTPSAACIPDDAERARLALCAHRRHGQAARASRCAWSTARPHPPATATRIQALGPAQAGGPRLLLASRDVTDLRESEERLLVAAHAIEGMTEAIVITAADGTDRQRQPRLHRDHRLDARRGARPARESDPQRPAAARVLRRGLRHGGLREGHWSGITWAKRKDGAVYREWRSVRAVRDTDGRGHPLRHRVLPGATLGCESSREGGTHFRKWIPAFAGRSRLPGAFRG